MNKNKKTRESDIHLSDPQCSVVHCIGWSISRGQCLHFVYSDLLILRILISNFVNSSMKESCHIDF